MATENEHKAQLGFIKYACVWEDADVLCEALKPVANGARLLSITSSGDNTLSLLTLDPKEIVGVDMNFTQIACAELRKEAFKIFDYQTTLEFLGVEPCSLRNELFQKLRKGLTEKSRAFWDHHPEIIQEGIIHSGKFEKYLRILGQKVLPWFQAQWKRDFLLEPHTENERAEFFKKHWNTFYWKMFLKILFSRLVMGKVSSDHQFTGSIANRIQQRTKFAITRLPTETNPYLVYILTGNYAFHALPRYLRKEFFPIIKKRLDRLTLIKGPVESAEGRFQGFNLSDIFEYMSEKEYHNCYETLLDMAEPGGRMVYWNMNIPRGMPVQFSERVKILDQEAGNLHNQDKAWFYYAFHIDEIL
jgi:S-adenosylmethionine-diacylglycerol 3-amino-3-carboxypropyl transferase